MSGPPPDSKDSEAYKAGWMDGYGDREPFNPTDVIDPQHPDYIRGRAKGMNDKRRTEVRVRMAGIR